MSVLQFLIVLYVTIGVILSEVVVDRLCPKCRTGEKWSLRLLVIAAWLPALIYGLWEE
jgi:hypothetical protein